MSQWNKFEINKLTNSLFPFYFPLSLQTIDIIHADILLNAFGIENGEYSTKFQTNCIFRLLGMCTWNFILFHTCPHWNFSKRIGANYMSDWRRGFQEIISLRNNDIYSLIIDQRNTIVFLFQLINTSKILVHLNRCSKLQIIHQLAKEKNVEAGKSIFYKKL